MARLQKYANNDLFLNVVSRIKSVKSALRLKKGGGWELAESLTDDISNKNVCYLKS